MPLTIRPENLILADMLARVAADSETPVTDFTPGSVALSFLETQSMQMGELNYALFALWQTFFFGTAKDTDLDARGADVGIVRDVGQPASTTILYTRVSTWIDDIILTAPQGLLAILENKSQVTYRTTADAKLLPQGRSVSGFAPVLSITSGADDQLRINLDGDGLRTLVLGTQGSLAAIASAIQVAVRALTALTPGKQLAYDGFRCDWNVSNSGQLTLRSGTTGPTSSVVIMAAVANNATVDLKLGLDAGGSELIGMDTVTVPCTADQLGILGNLGHGQINLQQSPAAGIVSVANPLDVVNGRERASDDAYLQDIRATLLALGRGTTDAMTQAALNTRSVDDLFHVQSVQIVGSAGHSIVYITDGVSSDIGAQGDLVDLVQAELDGSGTQAGGWVASGNTVAVLPAFVVLVPMHVVVWFGPDTDLVVAQATILRTIRALIRKQAVGESLSYVTTVRAIDDAVDQVLRVDFITPVQFAVTPQQEVVAIVGRKLMPGTLIVEAKRA